MSTAGHMECVNTEAKDVQTNARGTRKEQLLTIGWEAASGVSTYMPAPEEMGVRKISVHKLVEI